MRLCTFEDPRVDNLEPLTLTRPAFDLRCGAQTLLERQQRVLGATQTAVWVRPSLAGLTRLTHADVAVNDEGFVRPGPIVFANSRWLPDSGIDERTPHVGVIGEQIAYVVLDASEALE